MRRVLLVTSCVLALSGVAWAAEGGEGGHAGLGRIENLNRFGLIPGPGVGSIGGIGNTGPTIGAYLPPAPAGGAPGSTMLGGIGGRVGGPAVLGATGGNSSAGLAGGFGSSSGGGTLGGLDAGAAQGVPESYPSVTGSTMGNPTVSTFGAPSVLGATGGNAVTGLPAVPGTMGMASSGIGRGGDIIVDPSAVAAAMGGATGASVGPAGATGLGNGPGTTGSLRR
jgi:hypothetical protein